MQDLYLIHSAKGSTWSKHKYIKKVGNKYIYSDEGRLSKDENDQLALQVKSGSLGYGEELRKTLGSHYGQVTSSIAKKFKTPSGSGKASNTKDSKGSSGSSKEKAEKESKGSSKEKSEKESTSSKTERKEEQTNETSVQKEQQINTPNETNDGEVQDVRVEQKDVGTIKPTGDIQSSPKFISIMTDVVHISKEDKYQVKQNNDGTYDIVIKFQNGGERTIKLSKNLDIVSDSDKKIKHSGTMMWNPDEGFYLQHSEIRRYICRH